MRHLFYIGLHPEFILKYLQFGIFKSALEQKLIRLKAIQLRDFAVDRHGTIDGKPYGGGDGMIMRPDSLAKAIATLPKKTHIIQMSCAGKTFTRQRALELAHLQKPVAIICGRFGGIDQRFTDTYVQEEISLGNFVISGGELGALSIFDAMLRYLPGVLGDRESCYKDSFEPNLGGLLEAPQYTRPEEWEGHTVPAALLSGDHQRIEAWRQQKSLELTRQKRADLLGTIG